MRNSLYVMIKNKGKKEVLQALRRLQRHVKGDFTQVFTRITANNRAEFAEFFDGEGMKRGAKCGEVYYAHPYSNWESGSNKTEIACYAGFFPRERTSAN